jgi:hypothetical protein
VGRLRSTTFLIQPLGRDIVSHNYDNKPTSKSIIISFNFHKKASPKEKKTLRTLSLTHSKTYISWHGSENHHEILNGSLLDFRYNGDFHRYVRKTALKIVGVRICVAFLVWGNLDSPYDLKASSLTSSLNAPVLPVWSFTYTSNSFHSLSVTLIVN